MTHMDYMWSANLAAQRGHRCETRPAESPADLEGLPPVPPSVASVGVVLMVVGMAYVRLHRPRRLRRGSIWYNPLNGIATLYL